MKYLSIILMCCLAIWGCKKSSSDDFNETPVIEFISVSPQQVTEFQDSLTFTISYKDGDGDLGENNSDAENLFLIDSRNGVQYAFRIRQLAPTCSSIAIQGNLQVVLEHTSIVGTGNTEQVSYDIYVVDRAGHQSNTVSSSTITVSR